MADAYKQQATEAFENAKTQVGEAKTQAMQKAQELQGQANDALAVATKQAG